MSELAYPSGLTSGQGYVRLRELRDCLQPREVLHFRDLAVEGLCFHSAEVRPGTQRDALLYAISANSAHGLARTQADKRKAVALLTRACPTNIRGEFVAPELVEEQTLENLYAFGDRLRGLYAEMMTNRAARRRRTT